MLSIFDQHSHVLLDPRATHSFVSSVFSLGFNRKLKPLGENLFICTSVCEVVIDGVSMIVELLPLKIQVFNVVLGMNFLSKYHASMDYF